MLIGKLFSLVLLLPFVGCAAGADHAVDVRIVPQGKGLTLGYLKTFPHAYAGQSTFATDEVILVDRGDPAFTQYLDVRELWSPMKNVQIDAPAAANAAVDWYVVAHDAAGRMTGLVRYSGAGYARITARDDGTRAVALHNANLQVAAKVGQVADPVGPSVLSAAFDAGTDDADFQSAKQAIDAAVAAAAPAAPPPASQPVSNAP